MSIEALLSITFGVIFILIGIYKKDYLLYFTGGVSSVVIGILINSNILQPYFCFLSIIIGFGLLTIRESASKVKKKIEYKQK